MESVHFLAGCPQFHDLVPDLDDVGKTNLIQSLGQSHPIWRHDCSLSSALLTSSNEVQISLPCGVHRLPGGGGGGSPASTQPHCRDSRCGGGCHLPLSRSRPAKELNFDKDF